jgi:sugar lactone lactonase YvrE
MWDYGRRSTGSLYRLDADLRFERVLGGLTIPNAVCFSPQGDRVYVADTVVGSIDVLEIDCETGRVRSRLPFVKAGAVPGKPDGATVDEHGFVWNARFGAGLIARFAPDGTLDSTIKLPVSQPTSCAFGGEDLGTLFITTATQNLSSTARLAQPLAGLVLATRPGIRGVPEPMFAG